MDKNSSKGVRGSGFFENLFKIWIERLSEKYIYHGSTRKFWRPNSHESRIGKSDFVIKIVKKGFSDSSAASANGW